MNESGIKRISIWVLIFINMIQLAAHHHILVVYRNVVRVDVIISVLN